MIPTKKAFRPMNRPASPTNEATIESADATGFLKETTATADYLLGSSFLVRGEWRRDFSNQPFFLTSQANLLKKEQNTATLGLIWWFGSHAGAW